MGPNHEAPEYWGEGMFMRLRATLHGTCGSLLIAVPDTPGPWPRGMTVLKRILLPLDGSRFAEAAAPIALRLAQAAQAELHLVLVQQTLPAVGKETYQELLDWARKGEEQYLDDAKARFPSPGGSKTVLVQGDPAEVLATYATEEGIDLVVMSTHGWGAVRRVWLGSVADRLIRHLQAPLLLVRPDEEGTAPTDISSFVVSLDTSGFGEAILPFVAQIALMLDIEIRLLHVVQPPLPLDGSGSYTAPWDPAVTGELTVEAETYLDGVAAGLRERGCRVSTRTVVGGLVADSILDEAQPEEVVALATHAEAGIRRLLLGSVADKVIRGSTGAVLVSHPA